MSKAPSDRFVATRGGEGLQAEPRGRNRLWTKLRFIGDGASRRPNSPNSPGDAGFEMYALYAL